MESSQDAGERIALKREVKSEACNMFGNQWEHVGETLHVAPTVFWSLLWDGRRGVLMQAALTKHHCVLSSK